MNRLSLIAFIIVFTAFGATKVLAAQPTIIIYSGTDSGFGYKMAELLQKDVRIDSQVRVVNSPDLIVLAATLPQTECIVIYAEREAEIEGLEETLLSFFQQGGGLVGIREICYEPSAGRLANQLFPIKGNTSVQQLNPREKRVRTYVADQETEINQGLPETFELLSMGTYFRGNAQNEYIDIHSNYTVPYRDQETGSPLIIAHQNQNGGRSVSMPGIWVIPSERLDVYYGNLVADPNFVELFTNSVLWSAKGSTRYNQVQEDLDQKIQEAKTKQDRLRQEAEEARRRDKNRRLMLLGTLWAAGIVGCVVIAIKMVLVPED